MSLIHHNPFPPRAALASHQIVSKYRPAWQKLNDDQQHIASLHYYKGDDWEERYDKALRAKGNSKSVSSRRATNAFMKVDEQAIRYGTQVAKAVWGDKVTSVQLKIWRQGFVSFENRKNPDVQRPRPVVISTGWRGLLINDKQNEENFAKVFNSLDELESEK